MPHYNHFVEFCYVRVEVIHRIKFLRYYLKAVYAGIAGCSSAGRTSGPPRKHTRARCAQRAQPEALEALEEVRVLSATLQEESKGLRAHAQRLREQSVTLCDWQRPRPRASADRGGGIRCGDLRR